MAILQRYLDGKEYVKNYNNYDANKSLTVDQSDLEFVTSKVLGRIHSSYFFSREANSCVAYPNISGFTPDYSIDMTEKLACMKYSFETNKTSEYNLTPVEASVSSDASANMRSVFEEAERYPSSGAENDGMILIEGMGTGFIVGDHQIATVAHNLYNAENNSWRFNINNPPTLKTYNSNGTPSNNTLNATEMHIPKNFKLVSANLKPIYDYALITVEEDLSDHIQFSLGTSYNLIKEDFGHVPIYLTGCPGNIPDTSIPNRSNRLYTGQSSIYDRLKEDPSAIYWMYSNIVVEGGDSGSPLFTITRNVINGQCSYVYTALAINAGKFNNGHFGPLITKYQLQFYKNNPNINY